MSVETNFENELFSAAEKNIVWLNATELPKMLENYRAFHSAVKNIIEMLEKKKLVVADPYKRDKRVVDIMLPDTSDFPDNEGPTVLGVRLSDYETSLDFLCHYMQFSVDALTPEKIKKILAFNGFLNWEALSNSNAQGNMRFFSNIIMTIKNGTDSLSIGLLNNMLGLAAKKIGEINTSLKSLVNTQRELYKIEVRKELLHAPNFASTYEKLDVNNAFNEIKKAFPSYMDKKRFFPDLVEEIVQENYGSSKDALQKAVLAKFITNSSEKTEKTKAIDTKNMIFEVVKILPSFSPTLDVIQQKIQENHALLQSEKKSAFKKFVETIRSAFGIGNQTIEYKIRTRDMASQIEKIETIDYNKFVDGLVQRSRIFASLGSKNSSVYAKLDTESEESVLEFVQKKISDCQSLFGVLSGFDDFFKAEVQPSNRTKVKGIKIDLDVMKNTILKANKYKAEYVSAVTTEQQMKKLGITNE